MIDMVAESGGRVGVDERLANGGGRKVVQKGGQRA